MENIKIGLLDFGIRANSMNSLLRVEDLIEYSVNAEKLGFSRIWLAEHHVGDVKITWNSPDSLVPIVAGMTEKIRVGVAGILIGIHTPYHIASTFKLYNNLFGNRIDLGMANGGVSNAISNYTIGKDKQEVHALFESKYREVVHFLKAEDQLLKKESIVIPPFKGTIPEIWSLGVGYGNSMQRALETGSNLSRSIFHFNADLNYQKEHLHEFKELFQKKHKRQPKITMVFSGCCHQTTRKAKKVVEKMKLGYNLNLVGCQKMFYDQINSFQENYGIDEVIFMNVALDSKDRLTAIELISDAFNLETAYQKFDNYTKSIAA